MSETLFPQGSVLVVGGSGGIGRSICAEFAKAGTDVALTYHSRLPAAEESAALVRDAGRKASIHQLDVGDAHAVAATIETVAREHGRIHTIVFAAAAVTDQVYIAQITTAQWNRALGEEISGFFHVVQCAIPHMRDWGGGSFVHIGSAGDVVWPARDGLSVIPKAANEALVRGVAREEGRYNIRANSVLVGVVEAGMFLALQQRGEIGAQWIKNTIAAVPLKRLGKAEDIAWSAVFLASERAAYVTGQQIVVAGGFGV
jgi:3-oxoacyl-[acyl-carrier protein] reductase